jgi:hypothetical protein
MLAAFHKTPEAGMVTKVGQRGTFLPRFDFVLIDCQPSLGLVITDGATAVRRIAGG